MSTTKDGGPAFPEAIAIGPSGDVYPGFGGMSLRDWFAGQVLTRVYANEGRYGPEGLKQCAEYAYAMADAMLAAREPKP